MYFSFMNNVFVLPLRRVKMDDSSQNPPLPSTPRAQRQLTRDERLEIQLLHDIL